MLKKLLHTSLLQTAFSQNISHQSDSQTRPKKLNETECQNLRYSKVFDKLRFVNLLMAGASKLAMLGQVTTTTLPFGDPTGINTDLPILYQY